MLPNTIDYYIYKKGDDIELTIALGSIAENVIKTGIAGTNEASICVGTNSINTAIICSSIALVYV